MKCNRCGSVMVYDKFYGFEEHFWGWRCILCGEVFDQMVLDNRKDAVGWKKRPKVRGRYR